VLSRIEDRKAMKLTTDTIAELALPSGKDDFTWWDDEIVGFGYRLRASGHAAWLFQYRFHRQSRRLTAKAAAVTASAARKWAKQAASKVALGQDPSTKSEPQPEAITVGEAVDLFVGRQSQRLRPRSLIELKRHVGVHAAPLHRLPLIKVDRRAVAALLAKIGTMNGPIAANNVRRDLSAFFAWCCREGLIDANPAAHTNKFASKPRARLLSDAEARAIWLATGGGNLYDAIARLLMLLGCRRQEVGLLRWSEVDLTAAAISLPAERVKNARPFVIPLPSAARQILEVQPRLSEFVFGERGFTDWARSKAALDARSGVTNWVLHDLRRFFSTSLHERLGVPPHVCEALLGHYQGGIAGVYNRATYVNEKRQALDRWGEYIAALVEGRESRVVALRR
jgi:integrase